MEHVYDLIGIGFGPNNIGLAVMNNKYVRPSDMLFIEEKNSTAWQEGMLLPQTDIQHSPHRDFVTPINTTSRYTFLNYLREKGRLLKFLNLPAPFPFRSEWSSEHIFFPDFSAWFQDLDQSARREANDELGDAVVLATGFERDTFDMERRGERSLLDPLRENLVRGQSGEVDLDSDYSVSVEDSFGGRFPIYFTSEPDSTHGIGDAGTFPLLAYRSASVVESMRAQVGNLQVSKYDTA